MKFHIITIFPEAFDSFVSTSIIGKAKEKWLLEIRLYKLNEFAKDTSGHVDNKAFWMHGQVLSAIPIQRAISHIFSSTWKIPIIYMSPSWDTLNQEMAEKLHNKLEECIIICGHYEWIDQRIIDLYVDYEISIWNYVLTGGEISSQVLIDALVRLKPWVLGSEISHEEESFSKKLDRQKEYPVYTRPQIFEWLQVPEVLLQWDHKKIEQWKFNNLR